MSEFVKQIKRNGQERRTPNKGLAKASSKENKRNISSSGNSISTFDGWYFKMLQDRA